MIYTINDWRSSRRTHVQETLLEVRRAWRAGQMGMVYRGLSDVLLKVRANLASI